MNAAQNRLAEMILEELPVWQRSVVAARIRKVVEGFGVSFTQYPLPDGPTNRGRLRDAEHHKTKDTPA